MSATPSTVVLSLAMGALAGGVVASALGTTGPPGPAGPAGPLNDLSDVTITPPPADGQLLQYRKSNKQWSNQLGNIPGVGAFVYTGGGMVVDTASHGQGVDVKWEPPLPDSLAGQPGSPMERIFEPITTPGDLKVSSTRSPFFHIFFIKMFVRTLGTTPEVIRASLYCNGINLYMYTQMLCDNVVPCALVMPVAGNPSKPGDVYSVYLANMSSGTNNIEVAPVSLFGGYSYYTM
jgi:hypothetical protein